MTDHFRNTYECSGMPNVLLVGAECGIPALVAMLAWFAWHWFLCIGLMKRLRGTEWYFVPAGLFGALAANYMQSVLEWVLRQQLNLVCLMFVFALLSHLWTRGAGKPPHKAANPA